MKLLSVLKRGPFYQQLIALVVPIMVQSFMLALVSATDAAMLGIVSQASLSAVSLAGQVQFVINLFVTGIATGTGIIAAQYWGKGDTSSIERVIPVALRANLICGVLFTLCTFLTPGALMLIFTDEFPLIELGTAYLRVVSPSYLLCAVSQIYLIVLKNTGAAAVSSRISSSTVVLNIVLNSIFIFGLLGFPALGVRGAALATTLACVVELVWSIWAVCRRRVVPVRWNRLHHRDPILAGDFWKCTRPALAAAMVWGIAFTLYSVIMGHMGTDAVAANSIVNIAKSLFSCLIRGIGGGAGILIGNLLGAGELEKAREYGGRLTRLSILTGCLSGGALMLFSPLIVFLVGYGETASHYLQGMFPVPDALKEKKREKHPTLRLFIQAVVVPEMQIKLKQGFGRAIRTETDTCVVAILDERAAKGRRYRRDVLAALPRMPVTSSLEEVKRFIQTVKGNNYFMEAAS